MLLDLVHKTHSLQEINKQMDGNTGKSIDIVAQLQALFLFEFCLNILIFFQIPGTVLVHCSAGVGRTGTFLAVYKLWLDYINTNVRELSVFATVLELRKQRCLMVQKKEQYAYIAKCLR